MYRHCKKHPNSGAIIRPLEDFQSSIQGVKIINDIYPLISIISGIALCNPRTYTNFSAILSVLIKQLNDEEIGEIFAKIVKKFKQIPNTEYLDIWLQRIYKTLRKNLKSGQNAALKKSLEQNAPLCKLVNGEEALIWNSEWISDETLRGMLDNPDIINREKLDKLNPVIDIEEIRVCTNYS